ncbi:MAG TPA: hypothetical protein VGN49_00545 [Micrococcaceae bacterium]|jgi:hypothetical protein|nr:hypothetical protein [Micrococcaceae bacterium]
MIKTPFAESYGFTGRTMRTITTHAMSGPGTTERDYMPMPATSTSLSAATPRHST